jgi:hypothetical protein
MKPKRWYLWAMVISLPLFVLIPFQNCSPKLDSTTLNPLVNPEVTEPPLATPSATNECAENFTPSNNDGPCIPAMKMCSANDGQGYQYWIPAENKWEKCRLNECDFSGYAVSPTYPNLCLPLISNNPLLPGGTYFESTRYTCKSSPNILCDEDGPAFPTSAPGIRTLMVSNSQSELMIRLVFDGFPISNFVMVSIFNRLNPPNSFWEQNGIDPQSLPAYEQVVFIIKRNSATSQQSFKMYNVSQQNFKNLFSKAEPKPQPLFEGSLRSGMEGFGESHFRIPLDKLPAAFAKIVMVNGTMFNAGDNPATVVDSTGDLSEHVKSFEDIGVFGYWQYLMKTPNVLVNQ